MENLKRAIEAGLMFESLNPAKLVSNTRQFAGNSLKDFAAKKLHKANRQKFGVENLKTKIDDSNQKLKQFDKHNEPTQYRQAEKESKLNKYEVAKNSLSTKSNINNWVGKHARKYGESISGDKEKSNTVNNVIGAGLVGGGLYAASKVINKD